MSKNVSWETSKNKRAEYRSYLLYSALLFGWVFWLKEDDSKRAWRIEDNFKGDAIAIKAVGVEIIVDLFDVGLPGASP